MKNSGALLITGVWGCGKTYFLKNHYFEQLIQSGYRPVIVSLYGLKDISELPKRIVSEYLNTSTADSSHETIHFGKMVEWGGRIIDGCPKLKEWIDVTKLIGEGTSLYRLLPDNVVIFLDDLERACDKNNINEILGAINELSENRSFKVIIIANKKFLDTNVLRVSQTSTDENKTNKYEDHFEVFYEKVIEKNLVFIPDIENVFTTLVEEYKDKAFSSFLLSRESVSVINPQLVNNRKQRELMQNIRTLKFAVAHMNKIFLEYVKNGVDISNDKVKANLLNQWIFLYGISIESKQNKISLENSQGLDTYSPVAKFNIDFDNDETSSPFESEESEEQIDTGFAQQFYDTYYKRNKQHYVFYKDIYDFVLGGIDFDFDPFYKFSIEENSKFEPHLNEAQNILQSWMYGFWRFSDEDSKSNLVTLLDAVQRGTLVDLTSYYNASVYLLKFGYLIDKTNEDIYLAFEEGIKLFLDKVEVSPFMKQSFMMIPKEEESPCVKVFEMIVESMDKKINEYQLASEKTLKELFNTNIDDFVLQLIPNNRTTPAFVSTPVLNTIDDATIRARVKTMQAPDIMSLETLVRQRQQLLQAEITLEKSFFQAMLNNVNVRAEEKSMTGFVIKEYLVPSLSKLLERI